MISIRAGVLRWCSTGPKPDNLVSVNISKCYPASILIDNQHQIPLYSIHDITEPFRVEDLTRKIGELKIDEYVFYRMGRGIKNEAGFYSGHLVNTLIKRFKIPTSNVK